MMKSLVGLTDIIIQPQGHLVGLSSSASAGKPVRNVLVLWPPHQHPLSKTVVYG